MTKQLEPPQRKLYMGRVLLVYLIAGGCLGCVSSIFDIWFGFSLSAFGLAIVGAGLVLVAPVINWLVRTERANWLVRSGHPAKNDCPLF
jgi:hypothetical protein